MRTPKIVVSPPGPKTKAWMERYNAAVGMPKMWFPTIFSEGTGVYVKDLDDNQYLALTRTNTRNLGYRHPKITATAIKQMESAFGVGNPAGSHQQIVRLAEKLKEIAPPALQDGRVSFCNTGSDATEFSVMLARVYTQKQLILAYLGGHYGLTMGALALTTDNAVNRRASVPFMPGGIVHVPYPNCYRCYFNQEYPDCGLYCIDHINHTLAAVAHPEDTAAIFVEPIQSKEVAIPPEDYFKALQKICATHDILFVADEVMVGFGRTGRMWGLDHFGVDPDLQYMSKSIANGIPLAAIVGRQEIMEQDVHYRVTEGGAFTGNHVSCACALALIEVLQQEQLIEHAANVGAYFVNRLSELVETHELIGDVRGKGLLIGIELVRDQESKQPATEIASRLVTETFRRGVIIQATGTYRNVIRLIPPLILTNEDVDTAITILEDALNDVERHKK